jgi:hypothetical protein
MSLLNRFWPMGALFAVGFMLILYIALGFLYMQQGAQQSEFNEQIAKLNAVLAGRTPDDAKLREQYQAANDALAPISDKDALAMVVNIAEQSGIETDPEIGKLLIPPAKTSSTAVGGGGYNVLSFANIRVIGDNSSVMAFISNLDSGETLENMVLTRVNIRILGVEGSEIEAFLDLSIYTKPGG